jgi:hypothetical protein
MKSCCHLGHHNIAKRYNYRCCNLLYRVVAIVVVVGAVQQSFTSMMTVTSSWAWSAARMTVRQRFNLRWSGSCWLHHNNCQKMLGISTAHGVTTTTIPKSFSSLLLGNTGDGWDEHDMNEKGGMEDPPPSTTTSKKAVVIKSILSIASQQRIKSSYHPSSMYSAATANTSQNDDMQSKIQDLWNRTIQRAYSTTLLLEEQEQEQGNENDNQTELRNSNDKMVKPTEKKQNNQDDSHKTDKDITTNNNEEEIQQEEEEKEMPQFEFPFASRYKHHPALNNVALAHTLWASILRPNVDTAIDATCGNGHDSVKIAELLFRPHHHQNKNDHDQNNDKGSCSCYAQLVCLDIQQQACDNTKQALTDYLLSRHERSYYYHHNCVQVIQTSHHVLPRPDNITSVGLVVYNLGWLPANKVSQGSSNHLHDHGKDCITTMETTVASLADAALLLRVGGMISVITYPATNRQEDVAVRLFLECLALLSSNTRTWSEAVASLVSSSASSSSDFDHPTLLSIASHVNQAMERVLQSGPLHPTWRVSQHEKLGMDMAPILITATRIK